MRLVSINVLVCHFQGLIITILTTSSIWLILCMLYLPYGLFWSSSVTEIQNEEEIIKDFLSWKQIDRIGIIIILFLLLADCLLLVGIRREEK